MTEEKKDTKNSNYNKDKNPGFFKSPKGNKPGDKPKFNVYLVYGVIALAIFVLQFMYVGSEPVNTN